MGPPIGCMPPRCPRVGFLSGTPTDQVLVMPDVRINTQDINNVGYDDCLKLLQLAIGGEETREAEMEAREVAMEIGEQNHELHDFFLHNVELPPLVLMQEHCREMFVRVMESKKSKEAHGPLGEGDGGHGEEDKVEGKEDKAEDKDEGKEDEAEGTGDKTEGKDNKAEGKEDKYKGTKH